MPDVDVDELTKYRTKYRTNNSIPGVEAAELGVERRGAIRSPGVNRSAISGVDVYEGERPSQPPRVSGNPNVGAAGSAEAQAFRAARAGEAAAAQAAAPAAQQATQAAANAAPRLGALRAAAGTAARALSPTNPVGLALTTAPVLAKELGLRSEPPEGRERGAGREFSNPNAGNPAAGDLRPGQLGAIREKALQQARAESLRAAYANPEAAGQNIGAINTLIQQQANQAAVRSTPLPPTGAGAGRGLVNPSDADIQAAQAANGAAQPVAAPTGAGAGRGFVNPPPVQPAPQGNGIQTISDFDHQLAAEGQARLARETAGGPSFSSTGYGDRLARLNAETTADSLRFDARLRGGQQGQELLRQAQDAQDAPIKEQLARAGLENQLQLGAIRERGGLQQTQLATSTTRRGQDLEAIAAAQRNANALAVEQARGKSSLDVAKAAGDSRIEAAEARANATKYQAINLPDTETATGAVLKGGQVLVGSDNQIIRVPNEAGAAAGGTKPTPKAEYEKLPKGAKYIGPDGKQYVKQV